VRRYFLVSDEKISIEDPKVKQIFESIEKNKSKDDKIYALDCNIEEFFKKYPFVFLTK